MNVKDSVSPNDAAHFHAFGYAIVKQCIASSELDALRAAFDRVMQSAARYDDFGSAGTRLLAHGEDADAAIAELVGHDRLIASLHALFRRAPLYIGSFLMLAKDDIAWHTTGLPGEGAESVTVRVVVYLDETSERDGALRVLPGTHHPDYSRALFRGLGHWEGRGSRLRLDPRWMPGTVALSTEPGDVLVWYTRLWHGSSKREGGQPKRGIYLSFVPDPGNDPIDGEKLRLIAHAGRSTRRPYLYGDALGLAQNPRIRSMVARLTELGVPNVMRDGRE